MSASAGLPHVAAGLQRQEEGVGGPGAVYYKLSTSIFVYLYLHDASLVQEMARGREEGRAARLYTVSLLLLAATWSPLYTLATLQVDTLDISTIYISRYLHIHHNAGAHPAAAPPRRAPAAAGDGGRHAVRAAVRAAARLQEHQGEETV